MGDAKMKSSKSRSIAPLIIICTVIVQRYASLEQNFNLIFVEIFLKFKKSRIYKTYKMSIIRLLAKLEAENKRKETEKQRESHIKVYLAL